MVTGPWEQELAREEQVRRHGHAPQGLDEDQGVLERLVGQEVSAMSREHHGGGGKEAGQPCGRQEGRKLLKLWVGQPLPKDREPRCGQD